MERPVRASGPRTGWQNYGPSGGRKDENLRPSSCHRIIEPAPTGCYILRLRCHLPVPGSIHARPFSKVSERISMFVNHEKCPSSNSSLCKAERWKLPYNPSAFQTAFASNPPNPDWYYRKHTDLIQIPVCISAGLKLNWGKKCTPPHPSLFTADGSGR